MTWSHDIRMISRSDQKDQRRFTTRCRQAAENLCAALYAVGRMAANQDILDAVGQQQLRMNELHGWSKDGHFNWAKYVRVDVTRTRIRGGPVLAISATRWGMARSARRSLGDALYSVGWQAVYEKLDRALSARVFWRFLATIDVVKTMNETDWRRERLREEMAI